MQKGKTGHTGTQKIQ